MFLISQSNLIDDLLSGLERLCVAFNNFFEIFFKYIKYIFVIVLLVIGILTLLKLRGFYFHSRPKNGKNMKVKDQFHKPRLILGIFYIIFALGILFNWFTYFLIWILDPLPDRLIFSFINFNGDIDPYYMNRIMDINSAIYPHEQTIYYCVAMASFGAILDLVISIKVLVEKSTKNLKIAFGFLIGGLTTAIMAGFTTCLPFFL